MTLAWKCRVMAGTATYTTEALYEVAPDASTVAPIRATPVALRSGASETAPLSSAFIPREPTASSRRRIRLDGSCHSRKALACRVPRLRRFQRQHLSGLGLEPRLPRGRVRTAAGRGQSHLRTRAIRCQGTDLHRRARR